jgi:hypothetical protein
MFLFIIDFIPRLLRDIFRSTPRLKFSKLRKSLLDLRVRITESLFIAEGITKEDRREKPCEGRIGPRGVSAARVSLFRAPLRISAFRLGELRPGIALNGFSNFNWVLCPLTRPGRWLVLRVEVEIEALVTNCARTDRLERRIRFLSIRTNRVGNLLGFRTLYLGTLRQICLLKGTGRNLRAMPRA